MEFDWNRGTIIPCGLFVAGFSFYLFSLCPGVFVGDSAELTVAGWFLESLIPLDFRHTLMHQGNSLHPVREHRLRLNLFSALLGAALILVPFSSSGLGFPTAIGVLSSLLFMITPNLWSQAVIARVYMLSIFSIFLLCCWFSGIE